MTRVFTPRPECVSGPLSKATQGSPPISWGWDKRWTCLLTSCLDCQMLNILISCHQITPCSCERRCCQGMQRCMQTFRKHSDDKRNTMTTKLEFSSLRKKIWCTKEILLASLGRIGSWHYSMKDLSWLWGLDKLLIPCGRSGDGAHLASWWGEDVQRKSTSKSSVSWDNETCWCIGYGELPFLNNLNSRSEG